jgi:hypothetical protein
VLAPVGRGVVKFEGISDVKMVADGERMNFWVITASKACVKPVLMLIERPKLGIVMGKHTLNLASTSNDN